MDNTESYVEGQVVWPRPEDGLARAAENEGKGDVGSENDYLALLVAIIEVGARYLLAVVLVADYGNRTSHLKY